MHCSALYMNALYLPGILFGTVLSLSCQVQCAPTTVWGSGMKCLALPNPSTPTSVPALSSPLSSGS